MHHRLPPDRLALLDLTNSGLDAGSVARARSAYGSNDLVVTKTAGWRRIVADTSRDPMLWFLLGTAGLFLMLGDHVEAVVLVVALVPIMGMDAWLHWRTQASTAGLASRIGAEARALRDGEWCSIPSRDVVPGDLLEIRASENAVADGVVISAESAQMDESAMTGESLPVRKRAAEAALDGVDHEHWVSAGTRVLSGTVHMRVLMTGGDSVYGGIVRSAQAADSPRTPLQHSLDGLVGQLLIAAAVLCIALAATRLWQGHGWIDALLSGATLAIAAFPEEFPVAFAVFLGVGVYRLARRQALVRRAAVVENIGRVSCLCTDKTGTLTEGKLRLEHVLPAEGIPEAVVLSVAAGASREEGGDPMDQAVLARGSALGARVATVPFTEQTRREVGVWRGALDVLSLAAKGAPETLLAMSGLAGDERARWLQEVAGLAATGHKVIAVARRDLDTWTGTPPEAGWQFLGVIAFEDPLRAGAAETVQAVKAAGLRLIMVTGDHPATAQAIAAEAGLGSTPPRTIEGEALLQALSNDAQLQHVDVVARCTPAQKLALVKALQQQGEVVAVTGDGINDVPALAAADVGIAMGGSGTRSAREAAAIVLLDDDLRSLVRAIAEGRQLFVNLQMAFAYLLMIHIPLVLSAAVVPFAGLPLLYLPIHIVWLELLIHPTMLLVFQDTPDETRPIALRRGRQLRFFDAGDWRWIVGTGLVLSVLVCGIYAVLLDTAGSAAHARTVTMVAMAWVSVGATVGLSTLRSRVTRLVVLTTVVSTIALVQITPIAALLKLTSVSWADAGLSVSAGVLAWIGAAGLARRLSQNTD